MKIIINEKPKGKQRPRHTKYGITYTPKETKDYEDLIKIEAIRQCRKELIPEWEGEVKIKIIANFEPPKSVSKKKRQELLESVGYTHKPDWDNIGKMVCDALNGVAYKDDSQIGCALVFKNYAEKDSLEIEIEYIEG